MSKSNVTVGLLASSYAKSLERREAFDRGECERLAREWSDGAEARPKRACPICGRPVGVKRPGVLRRVLTRLGEVEYRRHQHYCNRCEVSFFPRDAEVGLPEVNMTEDVQDFAMDLMVTDTFENAARRLALHHGIERSVTALQDLFEHITAKVADREEPKPPVSLPLGCNAEEPVVILNDGSMVHRTDGWHEMNLLSVGELHATARVYLVDHDKGRLRAQLQATPGFEQLVRRTVLWVADGAPCNFTLQEEVCPHAHVLVDYWHVREHLFDAAKGVFGEKDECVPLFVEQASRLLLESQIVVLLHELVACEGLAFAAKSKTAIEALRKLRGYLERHQDRLDYAKFRANGWPIGSGAIESANKWVLQVRMKRPGMRWSPRNALRMATARAVHASVGPETFAAVLRRAA